jgi:putative Mg2+ transporter-C (MgtC) family protein
LECINLVIIGRVVGALVIGAMIGFERTFHGRPAGFRTHALVCIASAILMIVTVYQNEWMTAVTHDAIRTDPTRMAQGIMTGIGFLGAGVIFKEGLTVRGLTTAASIWSPQPSESWSVSAFGSRRSSVPRQR